MSTVNGGLAANLATPPLAATAQAPRPGFLRRLLRDPLAVISLAWLTVVLLASVFAPLLTSQDPIASKITDALAPMGGDHPLGGPPGEAGSLRRFVNCPTHHDISTEDQYTDERRGESRVPGPPDAPDHASPE